MRERRRLLALLEDPEGPSARLRFHCFADLLGRQGVQVTVRGFPRGRRARRRALHAAAGFDVTYWQRRLLVPWDVARLRRAARRLVFDLDDALALRDAPPHESWTRAWKFKAAVRAADLVFAGSAKLTTLVDQHGGRAQLMPTLIPSAPVRGSDERSRSPLLAWVGQPSTLPYLAAVAPAINQALRRHPQAGLELLGGGAAASSLLPEARCRDWSEESERSLLATAWVGLAPLPDTPWTRGKCAARLLAYLAAGCPAVASPVGAQSEVARVCGGIVLAADLPAWERALDDLLGDPVAARELGLAGRQRAEEHYGHRSWETRWWRGLWGAGVASNSPDR